MGTALRDHHAANLQLSARCPLLDPSRDNNPEQWDPKLWQVARWECLPTHQFFLNPVPDSSSRPECATHPINRVAPFHRLLPQLWVCNNESLKAKVDEAVAV